MRFICFPLAHFYQKSSPASFQESSHHRRKALIICRFIPLLGEIGFWQKFHFPIQSFEFYLDSQIREKQQHFLLCLPLRWHGSSRPSCRITDVNRVWRRGTQFVIQRQIQASWALSSIKSSSLTTSFSIKLLLWHPSPPPSLSRNKCYWSAAATSKAECMSLLSFFIKVECNLERIVDSLWIYGHVYFSLVILHL